VIFDMSHVMFEMCRLMFDMCNVMFALCRVHLTAQHSWLSTTPHIPHQPHPFK